MPNEVKQMVSPLRKGYPQKLKIACMLALGFSGFMRWEISMWIGQIYTCRYIPVQEKNDKFRQGLWVKVARTGLAD